MRFRLVLASGKGTSVSSKQTSNFHRRDDPTCLTGAKYVKYEMLCKSLQSTRFLVLTHTSSVHTLKQQLCIIGLGDDGKETANRLPQ